MGLTLSCVLNDFGTGQAPVQGLPPNVDKKYTTQTVPAKTPVQYNCNN
jgi:hypothetical protein